MAYQTTQFRFPMGKIGCNAARYLYEAVSDYVRYAPNQGGDETKRENIHAAFYIVRSRLDRGMSIQSATGDLWRIAESMRDM